MSPKFDNVPGTKAPPESLPAQMAVKFRDALQLHQEGQLPRAETICSEILNAHPKHFDTLHLFGVVALQRNDYKRAVDLIGNAIAITH